MGYAIFGGRNSVAYRAVLGPKLSRRNRRIRLLHPTADRASRNVIFGEKRQVFGTCHLWEDVIFVGRNRESVLRRPGCEAPPARYCAPRRTAPRGNVIFEENATYGETPCIRDMSSMRRRHLWSARWRGVLRRPGPEAQPAQYAFGCCAYGGLRLAETSSLGKAPSKENHHHLWRAQYLSKCHLWTPSP